jgi:hypothetical protein
LVPVVEQPVLLVELEPLVPLVDMVDKQGQVVWVQPLVLERLELVQLAC